MNQSDALEKQKMLGDLVASQEIEPIDSGLDNETCPTQNALTLSDLKQNSQNFCRRFSDQVDSINFGTDNTDELGNNSNVRHVKI